MALRLARSGRHTEVAMRVVEALFTVSRICLHSCQKAAVWLILARIVHRTPGTALTISPDGELLASHRKLMPTGTERLTWGFGDGAGIRVADTPAGKVGSVICWEVSGRIKPPDLEFH